MFKSEAFIHACEQIDRARAALQQSSAALGNIHRGALSDGGINHLKAQILKIKGVDMELKDYRESLDYDMDESGLRLICQNGEEE